MELIDKSALVAEIEKRINFNKTLNSHSRLDECKAILSFINSLEVKEVDFDGERRKYLTEHFNVYEDGILQSKRSNLPLDTYDVIKIAKHFFELGLKASQPTTPVYGIEEALKENGIDPDSKEADMYIEAIYKIYDRLKALKGK